MVEIKPCTFRDIQDATELVAEYTSCALPGLPVPAVQWQRYEQLEAAGALDVFAAYQGGAMIGFISTLSQVSLHYGKPITVTESFYVMQQHRKSGAGLKLLRVVEQLAREKQSAGLLITAPSGEALEVVLSATGYALSHKVFFKGISHE